MISDARLDDALAAYRAQDDHRKGMIAGLTAADLYMPEWLEDALKAWNGAVPRGSSREQAQTVAMRRALDAAQALCEAAGRRDELRRGLPVTYGAPPVWADSMAPVVSLWPDGTISSGGAMMGRAGTQELVRLLQLALRDQAALQAGIV